jgi:hypothetical protein
MREGTEEGKKSLSGEREKSRSIPCLLSVHLFYRTCKPHEALALHLLPSIFRAGQVVQQHWHWHCSCRDLFSPLLLHSTA